MSAPDDRIRAMVAVPLPVAETFELFTREIDRWWRRGPKYRNRVGAGAVICIEPRLDGRVFEALTGADGHEHAFEIGRVLAWEPPHRLVLSWRAANFAPGERTEVEVSFAASRSGTTVTLEHRGWTAVRADHPVRHGQASAAFLRGLGQWWGEQLSTLRELAARR
jgi:uncharacterized protein YndB with AHSA1/START domain